MIVRATLALLLEHGEMATTRQIADAAGIAEGTIFRVFTDKDELIAAVIDLALDTAALERAIDTISPDLPFELAVRDAVRILQRRVVDVWRLSSSIGTRFHDRAHRPVAVSDALGRLFQRYRARLAVEPERAARLLRAFTLSMTHPMLAGDPTAPHEIVHAFLHGVSAPDAPGAPDVPDTPDASC